MKNRHAAGKGMTLIEVLIATALIAVIVLGVAATVKMSETQATQTTSAIAEDRLVSGLRESILSNLEKFQVSRTPYFQAVTTAGGGSDLEWRDKLLNPSNDLPISWNEDEISYSGDAGCTKLCPGRAGFWIQQTATQNLMIVFVAASHPGLWQGRRVYRFLATY